MRPRIFRLRFSIRVAVESHLLAKFSSGRRVDMGADGGECVDLNEDAGSCIGNLVGCQADVLACLLGLDVQDG